MLPIELIHEPFSKDRHPCLLLPNTRRFMFEIDPYTRASSCIVGYTHLVGSKDPRGPLPGKRVSYVSVGAVYDIYGLDVAVAYLSHLDVTVQWTKTYLLASALELGIDTCRKGELNALNLSRLLTSELKKIDSTKPKMKGELMPGHVSLPAELVAKMVNSNRISKQVTACLEKWEMPLLPRLRREHGRRDGGVMAHFDTRFLIHRTASGAQWKWKITEPQGRSTLTHKNKSWSLASYTTELVVEFPLDVYDKVLGMKERTRMMLEQMKVRLSLGEMTRDEIRTWIVQLSHDVIARDDYTLEFNSNEDLHMELVTLLDCAIHLRC